MHLTIKSLDYAPEDLYDQEPIDVDLIREIAGPDRPDYWLAKSVRPIRWLHNNQEKTIHYLALAARWQGTRIERAIEHMPIGIAFVLDESVLEDATLDLKKCHYSAIGLAYDTTNGQQPRPLTEMLSGSIGAGFNMGTKPAPNLWQRVRCLFTDRTKR